ncbi:uracil-DNA glycosylase [Pseudooceanicola sediminis]|uniref:Uracil-DNA glycosylase n=1 Tax=Pseudooceanicola sediminis TaxID=2211117 RepID=A0A399J2Y4_9RHOB|nr:uracil-DNA glycosylase [Pseudooceanicola sediminis]KAA2317330.1 uracil-DNA glycosylase [Puniceibacterium sp. HSS470]RII39684.1 uracil-DNA glycosylase [Pseudooceanicola sediminis]|tara:strand:+ start:7952 stop:8623 length:672 start_codon:yes stop_codon:yes gene_type:complete
MTETSPPPPAAWAHLPFFRDNYPEICAHLAGETRQVLPPASQRFAALALTPPDATRVVILGQDPYPTPGHAHGLAFSAEPDVRPLPRSLGNIYKEMQSDLGACPPDADLRFLARQGVLLLNTALSVPAGAANGHAKLGWQTLTQQVLGALNDRPRAYLLWGKPAQAYAPLITAQDALILCSPHPSPLSAHRGFFGARPFSTVNNWLTARGESAINWTNPGAPS